MRAQTLATLIVAGFASTLFIGCGPNKPYPYQSVPGIENPEAAQYFVPYGQDRAKFFGPELPADAGAPAAERLEGEELEAAPETDAAQ